MYLIVYQKYKATVTPDILSDAVDQVYSDACLRENAQWVGETLRAAGDAPRAADLVLDFVAERLGQWEMVSGD